MNYGKLTLVFYALVFAALSLWATAFFVEMHRELKALQAQEGANQRRLAEITARLQSQEKYLDQLRHDPVLVERLIREKLRFAKSQEFIFRFEEERK